MLFGLALACADPPAPTAVAGAYARALEAVRADPTATVSTCAGLGDPTLRADCVVAGAERLTRTDAAAATGLCATLPAGLEADECGFQVAERSGDPGRCPDAGRFADDCRLHLWSQSLDRLLPPDEGPGGVEDRARAELVRYGFASDDMRPWSALYRWLLSRRRPFDRAACDRAPEPALVEACRKTGLALYGDLLNRARDERRFPCEDGPLPPELEHAPDAEIDATIARRRGEDLCP